MNLKPDELKTLEEATKECVNCGHLALFHNYHCCESCAIPGCSCEYESGLQERK